MTVIGACSVWSIPAPDAAFFDDADLEARFLERGSGCNLGGRLLGTIRDDLGAA